MEKLLAREITILSIFEYSLRPPEHFWQDLRIVFEKGKNKSKTVSLQTDDRLKSRSTKV